MEAVTLALALCAFVFAFLSLVASVATGILVWGWRVSTHKVIQLPAPPPSETTYSLDVPQEIANQLPSSPEPQTLDAWVKSQRSQLEELYAQDIE